MSKPRERIYNFIRDRILAGNPPTVREVQQAQGYRNVKSALEQIDRLVRDGELTREKGKARGLRLPGLDWEGEGVKRVPLLGRIQAGPFDLAVQELEGYIPVQSRYPAGELFALNIQGDSMIGANILNGDVAIVRRQTLAESGQVIVARVGDDATLKIFQRRGRQVVLLPANPAYPVLKPRPEELDILGRVVEVRRAL
ncbi:MAG: LexA repressor [Planctomycetota bacterium]